MKDIKMLFSLILRGLIIFFGWASVMYLIYGLGSGKIPSWDMDLALDSNGNIYVGNSNYIQVFSPEGQTLHQIDAQTNRTYFFTIQNDELYLSHSGYITVMNLDGTLLGYYEANDQTFLREIELDYFVDELGVRYDVASIIGRKIVVAHSDSGSKIVLKMPMKEYFVFLVCFCFIFSAFLSVLSFILQFEKDRFRRFLG